MGIGLALAASLLVVQPATAKLHLQGYWQEYDARRPTEKQITSNGGIEWRLFKSETLEDSPSRAYQIDHENESVGWLGDLYLNTDADPMWLDFKFKDAGREVVWLGVIRFEGDHLRWVRSGQVPAAKWVEAKGNLKDRPCAFEDEKKQPQGYRLEKGKNQ